MARIILIPRAPDDLTLDFVFRTESAVAVQASDEQIQALRDRAIPVIDLYPSGNEYAAAMHDLSEEQAVAAIEAITNTALAALTPDQRREFGVA